MGLRIFWRDLGGQPRYLKIVPKHQAVAMATQVIDTLKCEKWMWNMGVTPAPFVI